jgi:hypothetical protein
MFNVGEGKVNVERATMVEMFFTRYFNLLSFLLFDENGKNLVD